VRATESVKAIIVVSIAVALVSGLVGCGSGEWGEAATIVGTVVHAANGAPVEGAMVTDNKVQTTTDADGNFVLNISNNGNVTLFVLADGYDVTQIPVPAGGGQINVGQLTAVPSAIAGYGHVTGIIADAGAPVAGAQVWVGGITAITNANGRYTLYNIEQGRRTITASTGSKYGTASVLVISLRTVTADIAITSGPPNPY